MFFNLTFLPNSFTHKMFIFIIVCLRCSDDALYQTKDRFFELIDFVDERILLAGFIMDLVGAVG